MIDNQLQKIENQSYTVGVIGLGYVGLPLLWTFHQKGMPVLGFDIDSDKVRAFGRGTPYIKHLGADMMNILSESDRADATSDFSRLGNTDAILVCVPTPLDEKRNPDM